MLSRNWCRADAVMVACDAENLATALADVDDARLDTLFKLVNWRLPSAALASLLLRSRTPAAFSNDDTRGTVTVRVMTGLSRLLLKRFLP